MRYVRWKFEPPIGGGIVEILTEFNDSGFAEREIGFDRGRHVIHRKPSEVFREGRFGFFDDIFRVDEEVAFDPSMEIHSDEFERAWVQPDSPGPRQPGLLARLLRRSDR